MKKLVLLLGLLFLSSGVFASISISEPFDVYNLGDRIYIDLDGLKGAENGNLDIDLTCGNRSINLVRIPARAFSADGDQTYSIPYKILNWEDLGVLNLNEITGTCQIISSLGGDIASSKTFEISNNIIVDVTSDKIEYNPGETVSVKVDAIKANGETVNGFAEGSNGTSFVKAVEDGLAEDSFVISDTLEAGIYNINIHVYDVGSKGILNQGTGRVSYSVNQVATSLILSLSDEVVAPEKNFSIGAEVFDQSGISMEGSVFVKIISPDGSEIENVIQSNEFVLVNFDSNSSVGTWKIISQFDDLVQEREIEMMPLQKVKFYFEESVLVVENIGNVLYNRSINVTIGEDVLVLDLNIKLGEIRKFKLKAPVGEYEVVVRDDEYRVSHQILLTGNAVSVNDFRDVGLFKNYSIVWIFLIIVIGGISAVLFVRYRKTRTPGKDEFSFKKLFEMVKGKSGADKLHEKGSIMGKRVSDKIPASVKSNVNNSLNFTNKSPESQGLNPDNNGSHGMVDFTRKDSLQAESTLVLQGEKHMSAVVALSVKDYEELNDLARNSLKDIIEKTKGKGVVDYRSDYIFVLFNPLVTRTYGNESLAVKSGMEILENLNNYNKKFKDKISFGLGVHVGELIVAKEKGKLKYTGIGNAISFAKRMSEIDPGKVVISEGVRKKLLRDLRVLKGKSIGENPTYVVVEAKNKSADAARLKQLLARSNS